MAQALPNLPLADWRLPQTSRPLGGARLVMAATGGLLLHAALLIALISVPVGRDLPPAPPEAAVTMVFAPPAPATPEQPSPPPPTPAEESEANALPEPPVQPPAEPTPPAQPSTEPTPEEATSAPPPPTPEEATPAPPPPKPESPPPAPQTEVQAPTPKPPAPVRPRPKPTARASIAQAAPRTPPVMAPAPAPSPSAETPAASPSAADLSSWRQLLAAWLARHKAYPEDARRRGVEGTVTVRFTVDPSGKVTDVAVVRTSDSPILDGAAEAMLRSATLPPSPEGRASITVRIHYALNE